MRNYFRDPNPQSRWAIVPFFFGRYIWEIRTRFRLCARYCLTWLLHEWLELISWAPRRRISGQGAEGESPGGSEFTFPKIKLKRLSSFYFRTVKSALPYGLWAAQMSQQNTCVVFIRYIVDDLEAIVKQNSAPQGARGAAFRLVRKRKANLSEKERNFRMWRDDDNL